MKDGGLQALCPWVFSISLLVYSSLGLHLFSVSCYVCRQKETLLINIGSFDRSFGHSSHIPLALTIPMHIDLYGFHLQLLPLQFLLAARPACSTVRQAESARELTPLRSSFQLIPDASWLIKTPASPTAGISEASSTLSPWVPQCEWVLVAHNTTAW